MKKNISVVIRVGDVEKEVFVTDDWNVEEICEHPHWMRFNFVEYVKDSAVNLFTETLSNELHAQVLTAVDKKLQ